MKKLVKKLPVVAFVFALVAAFAFNMPKIAEADELHWFDVGPAGVIGDPLESEPTCIGDTNYCAVGLNDSQVDDMTGEPINPSVTQYNQNEISLRKKL
ncbi:MAG: DUF6520 family protein [Marinoscillum sp.]